MIWISSVSTDTTWHTTYFYTYIQCVFVLIRVYRGMDESAEDVCWPSVLRIMMRYCVAPATPVQPSLTVLPRDSTTLRLDTFPTGCSSRTSQRTLNAKPANLKYSDNPPEAIYLWRQWRREWPPLGLHTGCRGWWCILCLAEDLLAHNWWCSLEKKVSGDGPLETEQTS